MSANQLLTVVKFNSNNNYDFELIDIVNEIH
jgi:hypothetical protein